MKIKVLISLEIFLIKRQITSRLIPRTIEKMYKNGLITSCFCVSLIMTTSKTLPIVVAMIKKTTPTVRKNAEAIPKKRTGDLAFFCWPFEATSPVKKPIPNLSVNVTYEVEA